MKPDEQVIGEAIRLEYSQTDGKLFIVFEITNEKHKKYIKETWVDNIEYKIIGRTMVKNDG